MRTPPVSTKKKSRWRPIRQIYLLFFLLFFLQCAPPPLFYFDLLVVWCVLKTLPCPLKKNNPGEGLMDNGYGKRCDGRILHTLEDLRYAGFPRLVRQPKHRQPEWVILEAWIVLCVLTWPISVLVSILRKFSVFYAMRLIWISVYKVFIMLNYNLIQISKDM